MNTTEFTIRIGQPADAANLVEFNCCIARETEDRELPVEIVREGVRRGLEHGDEVIYMVAEQADQLIGCLMLTREWSDWRNGWLVWIQSVYVVPPRRGRGVFRSLLNAATEHARKLPDVVGMRLYVEVDNESALAVYSRTGFADPRYKVLEKLF